MMPGLRKLVDRLQALIRLEDGQDLVEYAMVIALIATGATAAMKGLASVLMTSLTTLNTTLGNYTV
ncbi:MAG: Flp family type IVb pilin [Terracidiphilus sp.]|jgi:pilus assembly protein Flp/PilA